MGDAVKKLLVASCALLLTAGVCAPAARADTVWTLQNAQFGSWADANGNAQQSYDGGLLSGSFTLDTLGNVTSFNLATTASTDGNSPYFGGWTYNNSTATAMSSFADGGPYYVQFTTNATDDDATQETLSLVFVGNLLNGKVIGSGSSLLCVDGPVMDHALACENAATPSAEFADDGNQDSINTAVNDPYRALSAPEVDPPACNGHACVTGIRLLDVSVPEPGTLPLMMVGLLGLGLAVWRRSRAEI